MRAKVVVVLAAALLLPAISAASADAEADEVEEMLDLYSKEDVVVHMDHTNFERLLLGKPHVWVVEFYNSWCGHCQLYAPTWRSFAHQTAKWERVARVGAINCARSENLAVCRNYEINAYPWVKFFHPLAKKEDLGEHVLHQDASIMMDLLVNFTSAVQHKSHPPLWPNLEVFQGSLRDLLAFPEPVHALLLESDANSTVGRTLVLDLADQRRLRLLRALKPPQGLQLSETARPLLVTWRRGQRQLHTSQDGLPPRSVFGNALRSLLGLAAEDGPAEKASTRDAVGTRPPPPAGEGVYMVDLENTVTYALTHEVAGKKSVSGEQLRALREFLSVLLEYLPGRQSLLSTLRHLRQRLKNRSAVSGEEVQRLLESSGSPLPHHRPWQGCRGSTARYRGYTCGLWTLFHTITVAASEKNPTGPSILPAIHGYVKHFFSCSHCSQHFQEMALKEGLLNVTKANQAAVWLWKAHNIVNQRLAGDNTEDPQHPKIQFPSKQQCMACYYGDEYLPVIVLSFLRSYYSSGVIKLEGLTQPPPQLQSPAAALPGPVGAAARPVPVWPRPINLGLFTSGDISLCVMLWVFSFVTLIMAFFLFRMKRRYKRKHSSVLYSPFP